MAIRVISGLYNDPWTKLLKFWANYARDLILQELCHINQWGINQNGDFVVIDIGYSKSVQNYYCSKRDRVVIPINKVETNIPGKFCGKPFKEIISPKGASVTYSFKTSKGSEYIFTKDGMSRRIKKCGCEDDGLHKWMNLAIFVDYVDLNKIIYWINNKGSNVIRIVESEGKLYLYTIDDYGNWTETLYLKYAERFPVKHKHVFEFMLDKNNIVTCYHPGHDVTEVIEVKS